MTGNARTKTNCRRARVAFRFVVMDKTTYHRSDSFLHWWAPVAIFTMRGDAQDFVNKQPDMIRGYLSIRDLSA